MRETTWGDILTKNQGMQAVWKNSVPASCIHRKIR
jgi:hypothetical protein